MVKFDQCQTFLFELEEPRSKVRAYSKGQRRRPRIERNQLTLSCLIEDLLTFDDSSDYEQRNDSKTMSAWCEALPPRLSHFVSKNLPGTPGKIEDMCSRASMCEDLCHPSDPGHNPVDIIVALADMSVASEVRGVNYDGAGWRARPWLDSKRYDLGNYREQDKAIRAVRRWKELLDKGEDPREAAKKILGQRPSDF